jgi:hypothetical protein
MPGAPSETVVQPTLVIAPGITIPFGPPTTMQVAPHQDAPPPPAGGDPNQPGPPPPP